MPHQLTNSKSVKSFLNDKVLQYNQPSFIVTDPISIPHLFHKKEDIEIAGFLTALISWGRRTAIIKSANELVELMDNSPHDFIMNATSNDLSKLTRFVYRTFNSDDLLFLINSLQDIYSNQGGLERVAISSFENTGNIKGIIIGLRDALLMNSHLNRSEKHLANPEKGSAAKRINMFLRWMIRQDNKDIDFGLWKNIPQSALMCPLDVHSGRVARKLNLLSRKQNDWKAVEELTNNLRRFDPEDPVKYDFALFGLGVFELF